MMYIWIDGLFSVVWIHILLSLSFMFEKSLVLCTFRLLVTYDVNLGSRLFSVVLVIYLRKVNHHGSTND